MARRGKVFRTLQTRFRGKRFARIEAMLREILRHQASVSVLDAGGRPDYWRMLPEDLRPHVTVTCVNVGSELAQYADHPSELRVESVVGDCCDMPQYGAGQFDLVHSNSVIEHVGSLQNMARFAGEVRRVGRAYYIQTPNFWFPVEPHYAVPFIHWLPDQTRLWIFTRMDLGYSRKSDLSFALSKIDHTRMLGAGLMRALFPDGRLVRERVALLTKSLTMIRDYTPESGAPERTSS